MNRQAANTGSLTLILFTCYLLFFTGLIFHFRAISSISTGLILLAGLVYNKQQAGRFIIKRKPGLFLIACLLFFIYASVKFLVTDDLHTTLQQIELKSALVIVPAALGASYFLSGERLQQLLKYYSLLLAVACLYCLAAAAARYADTGNSSVLVYHQLAGNLNQHAVYFSLLISFALVYLAEELRTNKPFTGKYLLVTLIGLFAVTLLLLSSKLVIAITCVYLLYALFFRGGAARKLRVTALLLLAAMTIMLVTSNPVSERFKDLFRGNISVVTKEKYTPAEYFNGLQFRLLQWRFVPEILTQNNTWPTGLGVKQAQEKLQQKYISTNMYTGQPGTGDRGYLAYNTHNQFLQSLLTTGIAGAILFLFICAALIYMAWRCKWRVLSFTVTALLLFTITEACFETQYGLLLFTFFPCLFRNYKAGQSPV